MRYLLDTNVVSDLRRKTPDAQVLAWFGSTDPSTQHISALADA